MGWFSDKLALVKIMFKQIDIEPFILLYIMSSNGCEISRTQLIQDKLCINKYNQSRLYCIELSKAKESEDSDEIANKILGDVAQYLTYTTVISTLPGLFFILFIASWIDSYIHARKIVLCMGALGYVGWFSLLLLNSVKFEWDIIYVLFAYVPPVIVGGWCVVWMAVFSFMSNNSSEEYRFLKFTSFELAVYIGKPLSIYIGGLLLGSGNYHSEGNIHHYERVFLFSLCCSIIALIYILVVINEKKAQNKKQNIDINENKITEIDKQTDGSHRTGQMSDTFEFSKLFNIKNFKDIFKTAVKVRPNKGRAKIWLLYLAMNILMLTEAKANAVLFPFTEKVYQWNAMEWSNIKSLASIVQAGLLPICSLIFSARLKLRDGVLGIIGLTFISLSDICIGSITRPLGVYLLFLVGSCGYMASLSIRSLLSKIASESESGKIFALLGASELLSPSIESYFLNTMFQFSIDFFPSLVFQIDALLNFIPLFIFYWIDLTHYTTTTSL